jgi:hypothetical protein
LFGRAHPALAAFDPALEPAAGETVITAIRQRFLRATRASLVALTVDTWSSPVSARWLHPGDHTGCLPAWLHSLVVRDAVGAAIRPTNRTFFDLQAIWK